MIHLLLGTSGGGKSYEAVVYHILPALEKGRKVITNLPLNKEAFEAITPEAYKLIEFRTRPQPIRGYWTPTEDDAFQLYADDAFNEPDYRQRVFANVWDYYSDWKHEETGQGALFVIDECQYSIPRGRTNIEVEEYTALHRHYKVDIIYITQSYGKISKTIIDNLQMVYRVRKQTAFGRDTHYIRKVQDGVRGEVMSVQSREYNKAYFQLYKSHTQSNTGGNEASANDVVPIWKHWSVYGVGICFAIIVSTFVFGDVKNPLNVKPANKKNESNKTTHIMPKEHIKTAHIQYQQPQTYQYQPEKSYEEDLEPVEKEPPKHPFSHYTLYILSRYEYMIDNVKMTKYTIGIAQNGQIVSRINDKDLENSGYKLSHYSKCSIQIEFNEYLDWITCGEPQHSMVPA